ncbi:Hsp20/alpha crystallin family protein [Flavobacterium sp. LS1P28]|uniref:Hsp20/alpha crystallin family protein n=1 Tax=Flavobacterium sp. LS1P28 TaxID=2497752 RepID=UPI000F83992B|nr:Hsp20/alpha crystallin family protein [Flavobacterium sp. LS1P28]RTY81711.1 Hsp20/alpha crystallin family protein [Flavobacterium sp. LS1P28]
MENDKNKGKRDEADFEIFGLGGLFKGIEKLVDLAGKLEEKAGISKEGEINFDHIKKGMKGVYGFTINTAGGGTPKVETFGNIKKTPEGPKVDEEREPITDIFDEENEIVVIAEMPGIEENDLIIDLKEDILEISAISKSRTYRKELLLPVKVIKENLNHKFINGILEINIKK